jgi:hypothetical protein
MPPCYGAPRLACVRLGHGGEEACGAGQSRHLGSGDGMGKARDLGRWAASAGGGLGHRCRGGHDTLRSSARNVAVQQRFGRHRDRVLAFEIENLHFLNTSAQIFEYESCRSPYPLQLSQRSYGVFLNRFCTHGLPTLNATRIQ